ncbi:MAG: quinol:cytochrome C oxidoreductase [Verrucomicrobia bacterium]|nr:MAG: quinol:cytochrome C oxidoreductase [Verrucomicrobiota bacterium]
MNARASFVVLLCTAICVACRNDMYNQPKKKPLAESEFFKDGTSARPIPANTVAREDAIEDVAFSTELVNGVYVTQLPLKLTPQAPIGHFYDVITNGYGVMYAYASRIEPADRWAISAYIRALQLSHNARSGDVPPDETAKLRAQP